MERELQAPYNYFYQKNHKDLSLTICILSSRRWIIQFHNNKNTRRDSFHIKQLLLLKIYTGGYRDLRSLMRWINEFNFDRDNMICLDT